MEKSIFLIVALAMVGIEFAAIYYKPSAILGAVFFVTIIGFLAFYLFQFGSLESFSLEALSAKAKFIRQKAEQVKADSDAIEQLKNKNLEFTQKIEKILDDLEKSKGEVNQYKKELADLRDDLVRVKMGLVEMTYLQYAGRNIFPNPFHERIMAKLNELLIIAVPDPNKRAAFVQELQKYIEEKTKT